MVSRAHGKCKADHAVHRALPHGGRRTRAGVGAGGCSIAWRLLCAARLDTAGAEHDALRQVLAAKESLLIRPIEQLMASPHLLSGWLSLNQQAFLFEAGHFAWAENPIEVLADTYHFCGWTGTTPCLQRI